MSCDNVNHPFTIPFSFFTLILNIIMIDTIKITYAACLASAITNETHCEDGRTNKIKVSFQHHHIVRVLGYTIDGSDFDGTHDTSDC